VFYSPVRWDFVPDAPENYKAKDDWRYTIWWRHCFLGAWLACVL